MKKIELSLITQRIFPNCIGFLITGSQVNNEFYATQSDIDIVVFDTFYSDVSTHGIKVNENFIDFTIIPVYDIQNIISNALNDPKKTLLSMIATGTVLFDTDTIVQMIKEQVYPLLSRLNNSTKSRYEALNKELVKVDKYFKRPLSTNEKFILLCEFVNIITSMEVIKKTNWYAEHLRKAKLLNHTNESFVSDIITIFNSARTHEGIEFVTEFIAKYQKQSKIVSVEDESKYIMVDISISEFSIAKFCLNIFPLLISHTTLVQYYRYWIVSPVKYQLGYKKQISLCFELTDTFEKTNILTNLKQIFSAHSKDNFVYEIAPLPQVLDEVVKFRIEFCRLNMHDVNRAFENNYGFAIHLCIRLSNELKLSNQDIAQLNGILIQCWLFTKQEQKEANGYASLMSVEKKKRDLLNNYTTENKPTVLLAISSFEPQTYYDAIVSLIVSLRTNGDFKRLAPYMPVALLNFLLIEKPDEAMAYLVIVQEILEMMNLNDRDKVKCLYLLNEMITDDA